VLFLFRVKKILFTASTGKAATNRKMQDQMLEDQIVPEWKAPQ
jgi:hypothetical protein